MNNIFLLLSLTSLSLPAVAQKRAVNKFRDPILQQIYSHGYNRLTNAVVAYFKHNNPVYRKEAALQFSSIQDSTAIPDLLLLLNDANADVRINAAFALGQMKTPLTVSGLITAIGSEQSVKVKRVELEALGRCANTEAVNFLCSYKPVGQEDKEGLARALYRAAIRKAYHKTGDEIMGAFLLPQQPEAVRHAAAYYFSAAPVAGYEKAIIDVVLHDPSANVRMGILRALRNVKTGAAQRALIAVADTAKDYRVRVDALAVLKQYNTPEVTQLAFQKLASNEHISVRITAAEYFTANKVAEQAQALMDHASNEKNWRVRTILLEAAFAVATDKKPVSELMKKSYSASKLRHEKILLATALATDPTNYSYLTTAAYTETDREVSQALFNPIRRLYAGSNLPPDSITRYAKFLVTAIQSSNKYLVSLAAKSLANSGERLAQVVKDSTFLKTARARWASDPYQTVVADLDNALAAYRAGFKREPERQTSAPKPVYKTFDWKEIVAIPVDQKIRIATDRGNYTIRLFVEEAPFTVTHFLHLVKSGAINELMFYRVIPNFVNQTGGTPSPPFDSLTSVKIRSEYNFRPHGERTVNMASSGRDTETSHWSIMLRPTPWNDYGYTVWGEVVAGMDVVNKLEMGDRILSVTIL
ncbi:hypothetical protein EXU57_10950 [Segetibacter sp. 3557_3]|uniref:peptidylprolyl isomerase n=1 Tax=Segetibacter sp. 3557_3 TaxID=2547429 RepID=UPI0010591C43|nr:peptidylprolyl isomerase [Segetibacter sp. 3557_3]TDH26598.1 hypothetical protein EXU57_10950 [Segetibacter sp. 3557_3]